MARQDNALAHGDLAFASTVAGQIMERSVVEEDRKRAVKVPARWLHFGGI